jgi:hypothetical protein
MIKFVHTKKVFLLLFAALVLFQSQISQAAGWNGIIPLKTSREEVEKILGAPLNAAQNANEPLQFKVMGGVVTVAFIDEKFVATNKLPKEALGKVRQIVLQHESSTATPEDMKLDGKADFIKEQNQKVVIYRNEKEGIAYTFIDGVLKTTNYFAAASQLPRAGKYWIF